nr:bifunctional [glutamine synthetase] adenylyltransferase/[glutamine synthetase]-adenylyl-L-tyrosine phosphorylase [Propionicicella superfundia]
MVGVSRMATLAGTLARMGFIDANHAAVVIEGILADFRGEDWQCSDLITQILSTADPDLCLGSAQRLIAARPGLLDEATADPGFAGRIFQVLGASVALGQHLYAHPDDADVLRPIPTRTPAPELRTELLSAVGADPSSRTPVASGTGDDLRRAYRRALLRIAARDVTAADPLDVLPDVSAELADLADATVESALALARADVPEWPTTRLGIVALGKTGARELNYVSDVDVLYVAEPAADGTAVSSDAAIATGTKLVAALSRICSAHTGEGTIWPIDAALRPEGKAGPLVRTMASHRSYYEKWAKPWEFQAMLKARPMAGDLALAQEFCDLVSVGVWAVGEREHFVSDVQAMRKRVISLIPARDRTREIKLGAGGLRDVEFTVQLLQLVHGRADLRLRSRGTFPALEALIAYGYVGRADGAELEREYRFQRLLEHRLQLCKLRRTHLMPEDRLEARRLARSVGLRDGESVQDAWRTSSQTVLRLHSRMFYSPLLEAVSRISRDRVRLSADAAETWLTALGYGDAKAALRHIEALSSGMSRKAEIQRQLLPAMLGWFAEAPNPDNGLLAFRQVSEALGDTHWYLRALRDEGAMAERLAHILSASRYAVDLLLRAPQNVALLSDPSGLEPRATEDVRAEMTVSARRHDSADLAIEVVRAVRRQELLRLAMGDLLDEAVSLDSLGEGLSSVASATIDAALEIAARDVPGAPEIGVIAVGRWGGNEMSYASDSDAMFVIDDSDDPEDVRRAIDVVGRLRTLLSQPGRDPSFVIDADLRPEGKGGPMVRTIGSYAKYYERWASTWEAQAMLRARPGAGSRRLGERLVAVLDPVRYPKGGLTDKQVTEIRRLKARMEVERMPRGTDPAKHTKLGPGGLSDVEWVVQLLQLQHGCELPGLRDTSTLGALREAQEAGLVTTGDAQALRGAWRLASRLRNAIMLVRARPGDVIPTDPRELAAIAELLGYGRGHASALIEDYLRRSRLARSVALRLFWGEEG